MRPEDTELCVGPNPREQAALEALQQAYIEALKMPDSGVRIRNQAVLCTLRDAIAAETGEDAQTVQESFESMALQVRLAA